MSEFFHMGGYAFYVWTSYILVLVVMLANFIIPIQREKKLLQQIVRQIRRRS